MLKPLWVKKIPVVSLVVTVACVLFASWISSSSGLIRRVAAPAALDPRISVFTWGESWRARTGRIMPSPEDWNGIFGAIRRAGVRNVLIACDEVFSRVNAATPGYLEAFRDAAASGISVYAPLQPVDPRPGVTPADPSRFGMVTESFVEDSGQFSPTSIRDLQMIPDASARTFTGPAPEFFEVVAGAGLVMPGSAFMIPLMRWRQDRMLPDLGLVPRGVPWSVMISDGEVRVGRKEVQLRDDMVVVPPLMGLDSGELSFEPLENLLDQPPLSPAPELLILGPSGSGMPGRVAAVANAAMRGSFETPVSWRDLAVLAAMALISMLLASLGSPSDSIVATTLWTTGCIVGLAGGAIALDWLPSLHWIPALMVSAMPAAFVITARSRRRDRRIRILAAGLSSSQLARSAMARQARMIVHDLRRVVKLHDPANAAYLDAFLVDLSALEQNPVKTVCGNTVSRPRQSFSIVEVAQASISGLRDSLRRRDLDVTLYLRHQSRLAGDPAAMRRILDNLIDNAAANASAGSPILVSTRDDHVRRADERSPVCVIIVANKVDSYSPHDFAVLGKGRVRDRKDGRGLGLVIVRRLAESMEGSVDHRHDPSTGMLEIAVTIPADRGLPDLLAVSRGNELSTPAIARIDRRLILVVDDSPFIRDKWERQSTEADILVFASPEEFLKHAVDPAVVSRRPILVTDYHFDGSSMDGVALARKALAAGIIDIVICSDWDIGRLDMRDSRFPWIRKGEVSLSGVMMALQNPST